MEFNLEDDLAALKEKLSAAIMADRLLIDVLRKRVTKNQSFLNFANASLNGYREPKPEPTKIQPRARGGRKQAGTKRNAVIEAIRGLNKTKFTGNDVLAEVKNRFPEIYLTREHISSLMWRLSKTKEGAATFRQVSRGGGNVPAKYKKVSASGNSTEETKM
jgi:hypothetical protein